MDPFTTQRTRLAERIDRIGLSLLALSACTLLFFIAFDYALPSFLSGCALCALMLPPLLTLDKRRKSRKHASSERTKRAEAAVQALLLCSPLEASLQVAHWLSQAYDLSNIQPALNGCTAEKNGRKLAVFFLQKHPSCEGSCDDVLILLRHAIALSANQCVICAACSFSAEAQRMADESALPIVIFDGKSTAALVSPLPDESPSGTGFKRKKRRFRVFCERALTRSHCMRYLILTASGFLAFRQSGRLLFLPFTAANALLLFFSLCRPHTRKVPEL